jgi:hypothetical protein
MLTTNSYSRGDNRDRLILKFTGQKTFKSCCYGKCIECVYDPDADGTWRKQVEECASPSCPLYDMRPTTINGGDINELRH